MSEFKSDQPLNFEQPESREQICARLEGKQIARFEHVPGERNPYDGAIVGLTFTDSDRLAIMAAPDLREGSPAPWVLKLGLFVDAQFIWSPTPSKRLRTTTENQGWAQERIEGEMIERLLVLPEITQYGGEQILMILRNAGAVLFRATPPPEKTPYSSGIWFQIFPASRLNDLPRIITPS
jgi:hypothetical protein